MSFVPQSNKGNNMKYILTSDWHCREEKPRCRLDPDWIQTQVKIIEFIKKTARERQARLFIAGDIFHKAKSSPRIESILLYYLGAEVSVRIMPGQHDLLFHSFKNVYESSFGVLLRARVPFAKDWIEFGNKSPNDIETDVLGIHELVVQKENKLECFTEVTSAYDILKRYPNVKYIVAGDNHRGFIHKGRDGRCVIVPGCITRQASDFMDYTPRVVFLDTDTGEMESIPLPDPLEYVTDEYTRNEEVRNEKIIAFVESLKDSTRVNLSFEDNFKVALEHNELPDEVRKIGKQLLEEITNG